MKEITPQYLVATESRSHIEGGHWRFVLQQIEGGEPITASDFEISQVGDRVALLAVVRGLEALPEPGRVVLVSDSRYVHRGFRFGLTAWQQSRGRWERFGRKVPVKNWDLWQRVAHALKFHQVRLRSWDDIRIPGYEFHRVSPTGGSPLAQFDDLVQAIRENLAGTGSRQTQPDLPQWVDTAYGEENADRHLACA